VGADELFGLIAGERHRAADMFEGLDDTQWASPTLCSAWTVRDLAGHLLLPLVTSAPRLIAGLLAAGGNFDRYSVKASRALGQQPAHELVTTLRARATSRFTPPGLGPQAPLTDVAVHTRDVARPLGLAVTADLATWRIVLDFLASPAARRGFVPKGRLAGLRVRATDQDWVSSDGSEIAGPSEALAMAMVGRRPALDDLSGPGVAALRQRLS
jgi:uncharacterized protein (TIGR03083 family)